MLQFSHRKRMKVKINFTQHVVTSLGVCVLISIHSYLLDHHFNGSIGAPIILLEQIGCNWMFSSTSSPLHHPIVMEFIGFLI